MIINKIHIKTIYKKRPVCAGYRTIFFVVSSASTECYKNNLSQQKNTKTMQTKTMQTKKCHDNTGGVDNTVGADNTVVFMTLSGV